LTPLGPPVAAQFAHHQAIVGLAVDADGTTLVSASPDGTIKLWSLSDGSLLQTHTGWTGELLRYGEARQALLADKERQVLISTAGEFADKVALRSVPEAAILVRLSGFAGEVTSLAAAPGGQFIAVGTAHGKIHLFARDGQLVRTLSNAAGPITAVAVTGDGKCIVAYSGSQTIHRWLDGQLAGPVAKDKTTPAVLGVTPNGDGVCWAGPEEKDPVIRLWSAKEDRQVREFKEHKQRITTLLVTADGRQLLSGDTEGRLLVWDVATGARTRVLGDPSVWKGFLNAHSEAVRALAVASDSGVLASGSRDKKVKLWSLPAGKLEKTLAMDAPVQAVAFSPDRKYLAAAAEKVLRIWPLPEGKDPETWPAQDETIIALAFTPDGRQLAVAFRDGTVRLWSFPERGAGPRLRHPNRAVSALRISADGKLLAAAAGETVALWSLPEGQPLRTLEGHEHWVKSLALTADGQLLASASNDKTVRLWSLPGGEPLGRPEPGRGVVTAVALTPDGALLAAGGDERAVQLRPARGDVPWRTLGGHAAAISVLAVTPDGRTLFSASADGVIAVWDLPDGRLRGYLFDKEVSKVDAVQYTTKDAVSGQPVTFTFPYGAPVPSGAVCVCNLISVGSSASRGETKSTRQTVGGVCVCDQICTCNTIVVPSSGGGGGRSFGGHYWFPN
jgi:WD40 repeat protein